LSDPWNSGGVRQDRKTSRAASFISASQDAGSKSAPVEAFAGRRRLNLRDEPITAGRGLLVRARRGNRRWRLPRSASRFIRRSGTRAFPAAIRRALIIMIRDSVRYATAGRWLSRPAVPALLAPCRHRCVRRDRHAFAQIPCAAATMSAAPAFNTQYRGKAPGAPSSNHEAGRALSAGLAGRANPRGSRAAAPLPPRQREQFHLAVHKLGDLRDAGRRKFVHPVAMHHPSMDAAPICQAPSATGLTHSARTRRPIDA